MTQKVFLEWENTNFTWENLEMLWEDVSILIEVGGLIRKRGGAQAYVEGNPWDITKRELGQEKTEKFIKLVCKVNDLVFEDVISSEPKVKVRVEHIEKVFNESLKIGIKIDF